MAKQKVKTKAVSDTSAQRGAPRSSTTVGAIVILLLYQGYTLSIVGIASPWIAKSFALDEGRLARLFAWMAISAFGSLTLARVADRVGRRPVILGALLLAPLFSAGAALAPTARAFAACEIMVSALLGGSVSSAIVLLAEELPVKQRARGQAAAALASAIGGVLGYLIIPALLAWNYSWRWLLAPSAAGIVLALPVAMMLPAQSKWSSAKSSGSAKRSHFYDIFHPIYRRRSITLLTCAALDTIAGTAVNGWLYYQAVSILGLSPVAASTLGRHRNGRRHDRISVGRVDVGTLRTRADGRLYGRRGMARRLRLLPRSAGVGAVAIHVAGCRVLLVQIRVGCDDRRRELRSDRTFPGCAAHNNVRRAGNNRRRILDARTGSYRRVDRTARRTRDRCPLSRIARHSERHRSSGSSSTKRAA